jgi:hypothetical protein
MRNLFELNDFRICTEVSKKIFNGTYGDENCGAFFIPSPTDKQLMKVLATVDGEHEPEWEHLSVSRKTRCPNWIEMDFVKRLFFHAHEAAFQFHPPVFQHVNIHNYCLHIWRPLKAEMPFPPAHLV